MSIVSKSKSYLDNKKAFMAWLTTGSTRKAVKHLRAEGVTNPETGKPFSSFAVWYSSWCWVLENLTQAKPLFEKERKVLYTTDEWEEFMINKAIDVYLHRSSESRFMRWIERNGFEKYEYIYAKEFSGDIVEKVSV